MVNQEEYFERMEEPLPAGSGEDKFQEMVKKIREFASRRRLEATLKSAGATLLMWMTPLPNGIAPRTTA